MTVYVRKNPRTPALVTVSPAVGRRARAAVLLGTADRATRALASAYEDWRLGLGEFSRRAAVRAAMARDGRMKAAHLIACPTCMARIHESCRTPNGHLTRDHKARLVTRRCPCGDPPTTRNATYCPSCAEAARREVVAIATAAARARRENDCWKESA